MLAPEMAESMVSSVIVHCLNALGFVKKTPTRAFNVTLSVQSSQYTLVSIVYLRFLYEPL